MALLGRGDPGRGYGFRVARKRETLQLAQMKCVRCEEVTVVPLDDATARIDCPHCSGRLRLKIVHTDRRRSEAPVEVERRD